MYWGDGKGTYCIIVNQTRDELLEEILDYSKTLFKEPCLFQWENLNGKGTYYHTVN